MLREGNGKKLGGGDSCLLRVGGYSDEGTRLLDIALCNTEEVSDRACTDQINPRDKVGKWPPACPTAQSRNLVPNSLENPVDVHYVAIDLSSL